MAEIKIAGIMRSGAYSPNHIGNDALIFNIVADQLRKRGCEVGVYSEEQLAAGAVREDIIVNMCREQRSIDLLQRREDQGALVINSAYGIENCVRERMTRILLGHGIPYPQSLVVNTNESIKAELERAGFGPCWIKRADSRDRHKEDVSYVRHVGEAQEMLQEYFLRGIKRAVVTRHLEGDLIKFYGVAGSKFFYWYYPFQGHQQGRSSEADRVDEQSLNFDPQQMRAICEQAADALGVAIYGGSCIVSAQGQPSIIDFNDWPSFAPCRAEAGPQIARAILSMIKAYKKQ